MTLEERAQICVDRIGILGAYQGYIIGANEQKAIDDKECESLIGLAVKEARQVFIDKACGIVRDLANEYFGDWEQSCKFEDKFRKAMEEQTNPIFEKCLAEVNPETRAEVRKNMDAALVWHKVEEELPKEEGTYLLRFWAGCSFQIFIGSYRDGKFGAFTMEDGDYVTHWMEIPALPKED